MKHYVLGAGIGPLLQAEINTSIQLGPRGKVWDQLRCYSFILKKGADSISGTQCFFYLLLPLK